MRKLFRSNPLVAWGLIAGVAMGILAALLIFARFYEVQCRNGRLSNLFFLRQQMYPVMGLNATNWPRSARDFLPATNKPATTNTISSQSIAGSTSGVIQFGGETFIYIGGRPFSDAKDSDIILVEITPHLDGLVGVLRANGDIKFVKPDTIASLHP